MRFFGSGDIRFNVRANLEARDDLAGKIVVDIPAGTGYMTEILRARGALVEAYDLFPRFFAVAGMQCQVADLNAPLPLPSAHADFVLCQEGIEHLPDPLRALREFNRILKPGGRLVLTTPNESNLRVKLSRLLVESDLYNRLPANELDSVWFSEGASRDFYFGHVFLLGIQKLRILGKIAGLRIVEVHPVKVSTSALICGVLLPFIILTNLFAYARTMRRHPEADPAWRRSVFGEIVRLNLNREVLFGKHLFLEFQKECELNEVGPAFYNKLKGQAWHG